MARQCQAESLRTQNGAFASSNLSPSLKLTPSRSLEATSASSGAKIPGMPRLEPANAASAPLSYQTG